MVEPFQALRPLLFSIAYRMLGSATDADDVIQDAWLRWHHADPTAIESAKAWLSTVVTRLCLDRLKSAQLTRVDCVGPWLPEPIRTDDDIVDRESISLAFLVLLERLTPIERAAYLLHEVFDYSHAEIAAMLDKQEAACRQLCHRAATHVRDGKQRFAPSRADHARLLVAFLQAMSSGDLEGVQRLLADDATLWADSNGKVRAAARKPLHGASAVAQFLVGVARKARIEPELQLEICDINGWPALLVRGTAVMTAVRNIVNPEKLQRI
jgi:RNA polymerase sigma-70 factor, ECF subfamily